MIAMTTSNSISVNAMHEDSRFFVIHHSAAQSQLDAVYYPELRSGARDGNAPGVIKSVGRYGVPALAGHAWRSSGRGKTRKTLHITTRCRLKPGLHTLAVFKTRHSTFLRPS